MAHSAVFHKWQSKLLGMRVGGALTPPPANVSCRFCPQAAAVQQRESSSCPDSWGLSRPGQTTDSTKRNMVLLSMDLSEPDFIAYHHCVITSEISKVSSWPRGHILVCIGTKAALLPRAWWHGAHLQQIPRWPYQWNMVAQWDYFQLVWRRRPSPLWDVCPVRWARARQPETARVWGMRGRKKEKERKQEGGRNGAFCSFMLKKG